MRTPETHNLSQPLTRTGAFSREPRKLTWRLCLAPHAACRLQRELGALAKAGHAWRPQKT
jgi:hypothetical protein